MLELFIKAFFIYSTVKFLYHWVIQRHHPKAIWKAMDESGSTLHYKVQRKHK
jgi:hypothetical protein